MRTRRFSQFNFDEWMALAQNDPQKFESERMRVMESAIAEAPQHLQHKLRCLQWRIDMERRKHSNALAGCISLNKMMWDFVYAEKGFLHALNLFDGKTAEMEPSRSAQLLPFKQSAASPS